jgi:hypothetical protein
VEGTAGLEQRLVNTAATRDDANGGAAVGLEHLLGTRGELDADLSFVVVVANDRGVVARGTRKGAAVARLLFNVADNRSFGHRRQGQRVSDRQRRLLSAVHKLASEHAFRCNEGLFAQLVSVAVAENNAGKRGT